LCSGTEPKLSLRSADSDLATSRRAMASLFAIRSNPTDGSQHGQILRRKALRSNPCQIATMTTPSEAHLLYV
jgi:hypothetical protein